MDYRDRHVVVTGGTGALGTATVSALVGAGAVCHVPYIHRGEAERFPLRDHPQVMYRMLKAIALRLRNASRWRG